MKNTNKIWKKMAIGIFFLIIVILCWKNNHKEQQMETFAVVSENSVDTMEKTEMKKVAEEPVEELTDDLMEETSMGVSENDLE